MDDKIRIVVVYPELEIPKIKVIANKVESIQNVVGGYFEIGKVIDDFCLVVNEEGMLLHLPVNRNMCYGTFCIVKFYKEDFVTMSTEEAAYWKEYFGVNK